MNNRIATFIIHHYMLFGMDDWHMEPRCAGETDWDASRGRKLIYDTKEKAVAAGKRYTKTMQRYGWEISNEYKEIDIKQP